MISEEWLTSACYQEDNHHIRMIAGVGLLHLIRMIAWGWQSHLIRMITRTIISHPHDSRRTIIPYLYDSRRMTITPHSYDSRRTITRHPYDIRRVAITSVCYQEKDYHTLSVWYQQDCYHIRMILMEGLSPLIRMIAGGLLSYPYDIKGRTITPHSYDSRRIAITSIWY